MTTLKQAAQLALDYIRSTTDYKMGYPPACEVAVDLADALAEMADQEPVGDEWTPCVKLPVVVHVRKQRPGEVHVSTREGITPIKTDDLIMRGVSGEEYPIGRAIFEKTYSLDTNLQSRREPLTDEEIDRVTDAQWARNNHKPIYAAHRAYARAENRRKGMNIIELAREAGVDTLNGVRDDDTVSLYYEAWPEQLEHFAALVRAAALEEAAVVCENPDLIANGTFDGVAAGIRALKGEQE
jgi:hypothetical protein